MDKKGGNVIFMPDIEYKSWVNRNKELLSEITKTGKVSTLWLQKGSNKAFLVIFQQRRNGFSNSLDGKFFCAHSFGKCFFSKKLLTFPKHSDIMY